MMAAEAPQPDKSAIRQHLELITARWHELPEPVWLEIRALNREVGSPVINKFRADPDWIGEAVDFCAAMNARSRNIYAVINPVRDSVLPGAAASDQDIVAAIYQWIDCDDAPAAAAARNFAGPKHAYAVITGRTPHPRPHVYWELEDWQTDMAEWRSLQERMAATFGSDRVVVNPSRIMRIAGTVTYPDAQKRARGYVSELADLKAPAAPEFVPFERLSRMFPEKARTAPQAATGGIYIDTGQQERLNRQQAAQSALSGQEWHNNVVKLTASYVAKGLADDEIHALTAHLTLPGWSVEQTRQEVQTAIDGARAKGWTPPPERAATFDHKPDPTAASGPAWRIQTAAEFVADFVSPEYLIDGIVQRGRLYTLTAPTGTGKTGVMLYAALAISTGEQFCALDTEEGDVLFLAGENPDDVRARVIATLEHYRVDATKMRVHFVPGTFSIRQDMEALRNAAANLPNLVLVVVDTLAAYFDGDDDNSNAQILDFARVVRQITAWPSKPCVIMPAHPVKDVRRNNLVPRGGGALLNEVDGNLTLWADDGIIQMHWQGKHRGADFEPITFEMQRFESAQLHDMHGRLIPTVIAKPVLTARAADLAKQAMTLETRTLQSISQDPGISVRQRAADLGISPTRLCRIIEKMKADKWLKKKGRKNVLTEQGEEALEDGLNGVSGGAE